MKKGFGIIGRALIIMASAMIGLVVFIFGIVLLNIVQTELLIPQGFDLWLMNSPWSKGIFILEVILIIVIMGYAGKALDKFKKKDGIDGDISVYTKNFNFVSKYKLPIIVVSVVILYVVFINVSSIKDDVIHIRSTFNPKGTEYTINDVTEINTGFYGKTMFKRSSEGEFFYKVTLSNGKMIDLIDFASEAERCDHDTYLSIEEFDKRLMDSNTNVVKNSSYDNADKSYLDKVYLDRFKRIVDNK